MHSSQKSATISHMGGVLARQRLRSCRSCEGTFGWHAPGAPGIQINGPAIDPNALPANISPSSSPGPLTPAVSEAHVLAEWLHHPCLLGGP